MMPTFLIRSATSASSSYPIKEGNINMKICIKIKVHIFWRKSRSFFNGSFWCIREELSYCAWSDLDQFTGNRTKCQMSWICTIIKVWSETMVVPECSCDVILKAFLPDQFLIFGIRYMIKFEEKMATLSVDSILHFT